MKQWKRRYLTPIGKITVIRTLLLPMFNHLFMSIPNPGVDILMAIQNSFYEFLWHGPAKIRRNVVVKQYSEGGLQMVNLKCFIQGLKLTWIRRVMNSEAVWILFYYPVKSANQNL